MVIRWTGPAIRDLKRIHEYIARDSRNYAAQVVDSRQNLTPELIAPDE